VALAKDLLRRQDLGLALVAERVGYSSASTFSRHVGMAPSRDARMYRFVSARRADTNPPTGAASKTNRRYKESV
jgi:transcriptional regulator GlxA family with amidase domain